MRKIKSILIVLVGILLLSFTISSEKKSTDNHKHDHVNYYPCHPLGDIYPCTHPLHYRGDIGPCTHYVNGYPLHSAGDIYPCTHPLHTAGDVGPCTHVCW